MVFLKSMVRKNVNALSEIISPNCVQLWRHESWKFFARYRGVGKFLVGTSLLGGHNLPLPLIEIGWSYLPKIGGAQSSRPQYLPTALR